MKSLSPKFQTAEKNKAKARRKRLGFQATVLALCSCELGFSELGTMLSYVQISCLQAGTGIYFSELYVLKHIYLFAVTFYFFILLYVYVVCVGAWARHGALAESVRESNSGLEERALHSLSHLPSLYLKRCDC